ncbi:MAG: HAD hydrolase family protein [Bacteroidetes bacterium]|nr:HAD hydrolase family protein [Bacteroidota bacterium]
MTSIADKFADIKILFFDLDGVLIQNGQLDSLCEHLKEFCDKMNSIEMQTVIITAREEDETTKLLQSNGECKVISASVNKVKAAAEVLLNNNLNFDQAFYIGDDILDIPLLQRVRLKACPSTARREVKRNVDFIVSGNTAKEIFNEIEKQIMGLE